MSPSRRIASAAIAFFILGLIRLPRLHRRPSGGEWSSATPRAWSATATSLRHDTDNFKNPLRRLVLMAHHASFEPRPPMLGRHHGDANAVFVFAVGYQPPLLLRFIESLRATGCDADIVLGVDYGRLMRSLREGSGGTAAADAFRGYLEDRARDGRLIVYDVDLECEEHDSTICTSKNAYRTTEGRYLSDPRPPRSVKFLRYEHYWAWSMPYLEGSANGEILVADLKDVYFQSDPFASSAFASEEMNGAYGSGGGDGATTLKVFVEVTSKFDIAGQTSNARWITNIGGQEALDEIGHNPIVCSGTTMGGAVAMESYLRAMIHEFDETECTIDGCDQGLHNYLLYTSRLFRGTDSEALETTNLKDPSSGKMALKIVTPVGTNGDENRRIDRIEYFSYGYGPIITLGLFCGFGGKLRKSGLLRDDEGRIAPAVLNYDGMVTPVIHQLDRCNEISERLQLHADLLWSFFSNSE